VRIVAVTGTGTGVGKTISSAAIAAAALRNGERVAVVKPVQTGVLACEPGDLAVVHELTGLADLHEFDRYPEPLAPATAARRMGRPGLEIGVIADRIRRLSDRDLVIVEGAGGELVRFNTDGQTFLDLVVELATEL
jgi:dethiobiotin synthetase